MVIDFGNEECNQPRLRLFGFTNTAEMTTDSPKLSVKV